MDFDLSEDQRELEGLAVEVLGREASVERLEAHEKSGAAFDAALWKAMAQAGLIGAVLPESAGGAGLGAVELAVLLRAVGRHVAPVPAYATLALGAATLARHGTPEQQALLTAVGAGETVLTGAVREPGGGALWTTAGGGRSAATVGDGGLGSEALETTARREGSGWILDGVKTFVPFASVASHILVPARVIRDAGVGVFLVQPEATEMSRHPAATGEPMSRVALAGVRVEADALVGGVADGAAWTTLRRSAVAGAVATVSGVVEGALGLTTDYVKGREQFDRPLAQFQAVTMQIGDVYIAKRALDVGVWAGVWRLDEGGSDVDEVLTIAAYNACDPAMKALYTCQHLHGGIGLDVTYPLHRYFAWAKHYGHLLGGAEAQLDALGSLVEA